MIISSLEGSLQSQSHGVLTVTTVGMGEEDDRTGFCLFFKMRKGVMLLFYGRWGDYVRRVSPDPSCIECIDSMCLTYW